jgi:hypothetical protein
VMAAAAATARKEAAARRGGCCERSSKSELLWFAVAEAMLVCVLHWYVHCGWVC